MNSNCLFCRRSLDSYINFSDGRPALFLRHLHTLSTSGNSGPNRSTPQKALGGAQDIDSSTAAIQFASDATHQSPASQTSTGSIKPNYSVLNNSAQSPGSFLVFRSKRTVWGKQETIGTMATNIEQYNARRKLEIANRKAQAVTTANTNRGSSSSSSSSLSSSKATPPASSRNSAPGAYKPNPTDVQRIKAVIAKYQKVLADEHTYIVVHALRTARSQVNNRSGGSDMSENTKRREDGLIDEVSPFKDMQPIAVNGWTSASGSIGTTVREKDLTIGRFTLRHYPNKIQNPAPEVKLQVKAHTAPGPASKGIPPLPKYHAYTTLRNNILAEDDEVMRYFPYFGEDAAENDVLDMLNLEEAFVDRTKNAQEENMRAEKGIVFLDYAHQFLKDLDLDLNKITQYLIGSLSQTGWSQSRKKIREKYLPEDFDFSEPKIKSAIKKLTPVSLADLEWAETVCAVFMDVLDFSLWEVAKRGEASVRDSMAPQRLSGGNQGSENTMPGGKSAADAVAVLTGGNPQPYSLESFAALNCLYCYMHECPFHVNSSKDSVFLSSYASKAPSNPPPGSRKHAFPEGAECSKGCFIKATDADRAKKTSWSKAQTQLLQAAAAVLRDNPRASCLLASVINKYCYEIEAELHRQGLLSTTSQMPIIAMLPPNQKGAPAAAGLKRKRPIKHNEYPQDCLKTPHAAERQNFKPCMHSGPCNYECHCVKDKVMCEKACACDADCPRKWRGCTCAASGKACIQNSMCPCVKWNRECDPDLCTDCGAAETLSPTNRYNEQLAKQCCQNVSLQRNVPQRTLLGVSGVSGLGLFIGDNVKKNTFLGEYKGEVITNDEAERRGKLYDKRGVSFLFNLNKASVIDATRAGNKFRFINHYKKPNCYAKVLFANCTHRIGMFAKRDLIAGEELYFDYGYNNKSVKFIAQEPDFVYQPPVEKTGPTRKRNTGNRGNWNTGMTARTLKAKQLKELGKTSEATITESTSVTTTITTTTTLPFLGRSRGRSVASTTRTQLSEITTTSAGGTGTAATRSFAGITPSVTDGGASDTGGEELQNGNETSRPGSRAIRGTDDEDNDSEDEPLRGRVRTRDGTGVGMHSATTSRNGSGSRWDGDDQDSGDEHHGDEEDVRGGGRLNIRGRGGARSDEDEEEDDEDEDEEDDHPHRHRGRMDDAGDDGDDDDDDDDEDEYPRDRHRARDRAVGVVAGKRRKL